MNKQTFISQSSIPTLAQAVINQLGGWEAFKESATDIANHGIGGGFSGFIYYTDTVAFFNDNKRDILALATDQADEFGVGMLEMIAGFVCLQTHDLSADQVASAIYEDTEDSTQVRNALAWFVGEEVARQYADLIN